MHPPGKGVCEIVDPVWQAAMQAAALAWRSLAGTYQERACCYGNGNERHAQGCPFGAVNAAAG